MKNKIGGWQTKTSEVVYENPWIKVSHEEVITPGNTEGVYGVVHFKNIAVGVIPLDTEGNTWLVRQSRYPLEKYTWEIPEGGSPEGEDPLASAKRELEEEVGLIADRWQSLLTLHTSNSVTDEVAYIYTAEGIHQGVQELDDSEDIEVRKLPLQEAINLVLSGEITDAMSVAGLLKMALLKRA